MIKKCDILSTFRDFPALCTISKDFVNLRLNTSDDFTLYKHMYVDLEHIKWSLDLSHNEYLSFKTFFGIQNTVVKFGFKNNMI